MKNYISPGKYIDILVRLKHQLKHPGKDGKGLTAYIKEELATKSDLSARQIARMRNLQQEEFPEGNAMVKLIKALPELEVLSPKGICNRLLLPWANVERDQEELSQKAVAAEFNNQLTIVAGWEPPRGLLSQNVALSIAKNIENGFSYEFIFPNLNNHPSLDEKKAEKLTKKWMMNLYDRVGIEWYSQQSQRFTLQTQESIYSLDDDKDYENRGLRLDADLKKFKDKLADNIYFTYTPVKTDFWLLMPSPYVVLYNLDLQEADLSFKFGVFFLEGLLLRQISEDFQEVNSQGWLYITRERYQRIEQEYKRIKHQSNIQSVKSLLPKTT